MPRKADAGEGNCIICGKSFLRYRSDHVCCGNPECRRTRSNERSTAWYKRNYDIIAAKPRYRIAGNRVKCPECGKEVPRLNINQVICGSLVCKRYRSLRCQRKKYRVRNVG